MLCLVGCASHAPNPGWHVFMYNLTADRAETTDLWATQREDAKAMLGRFIAWQASVDHSKGADEIGKRPHDCRSEALRSSESLSESCRRLPHPARRDGRRCWPRITMKSRVGSTASTAGSRARFAAGEQAAAHEAAGNMASITAWACTRLVTRRGDWRPSRAARHPSSSHPMRSCRRHGREGSACSQS